MHPADEDFRSSPNDRHALPVHVSEESIDLRRTAPDLGRDSPVQPPARYRLRLAIRIPRSGFENGQLVQNVEQKPIVRGG